MRSIASFGPPCAARSMSQRVVMRSPMAQQSGFLGQRLAFSRSLAPGLNRVQQVLPGRAPLLVEANGKRCLGDTTYGTRRARTRTSGFRSRKLTVGGRKVLRSRRSKGRKILCPANSNRGAKSTASSNRR